MDAIKKKMQAMKLEKDNAMDKADTCEQQAKDANMRAEKVNYKIIFCQTQNISLKPQYSTQVNEEVRELNKKLGQVEADLATNKNNLEQANKDLEEKEKTLTATESEVAALNRKVQQIEEDLEKSEERAGSATTKLLEATQAADENNRYYSLPIYLL